MSESLTVTIEQLINARCNIMIEEMRFSAGDVNHRRNINKAKGDYGTLWDIYMLTGGDQKSIAVIERKATEKFISTSGYSIHEISDIFNAPNTIMPLSNPERDIRPGAKKRKVDESLIRFNRHTEIGNGTTLPHERVNTPRVKNSDKPDNKIVIRAIDPPAQELIGDPVVLIQEDFVAFCRLALEITYRPGVSLHAPDGGYGPFILTEEWQIPLAAILIDQWIKGLPVRIMVLKARQLGITTVLLSFWFWIIIQTNNFVVLFIIDKDAHMREKRDLVIKWAESLSEKYPQLPKLTSRDGKALRWSNGAKMLFESAMSPNPGTSEHISGLHTSEKTKYPRGRDGQIDTSVLPGIPDKKNTFVVDESTAEGLGSFFKKWKRIKKGDEVGITKTIPIFFPWYISNEYRSDPPQECYNGDGNFIYLNQDPAVCEYHETGELKFTEEQYAIFYKLKDDQVYWRRLKIKNSFNNDIKKFDQEYPTTDDHAFAAAGGNFFGAGLNKLIFDRCENNPIFRGNIVCSNGNTDNTQMRSWTKYSPSLKNDSGGALYIYEFPNTTKNNDNKYIEKYFVGGDIAEGIEKVDEDGSSEPDSTAFSIKNSQGRTVAIYHIREKPEESVIPLLLICLLYNRAKCAIERNSVGNVVWSYFSQAGYNEVFQRDDGGRSLDDRAWPKTNVSTRKELLINYRASLIKDPSRVVHKGTALECEDFVMKDGRPEARSGAHDDLIIAEAYSWMLVLHFNGVRFKEIVKPSKPEKLPDTVEYLLEYNNVNIEDDFGLEIIINEEEATQEESTYGA